jgi:hypothetical protein
VRLPADARARRLLADQEVVVHVPPRLADPEGAAVINIWIRRRIAYWHAEADRCEAVGAHRLAAICRAQAHTIATTTQRSM